MRFSQCGVDGFYDYEAEEDDRLSYFVCDHIAIVSISATECQCMDCMNVWPKDPGFKSDYPVMDRG